MRERTEDFEQTYYVVPDAINMCSWLRGLVDNGCQRGESEFVNHGSLLTLHVDASTRPYLLLLPVHDLASNDKKPTGFYKANPQ